MKNATVVHAAKIKEKYDELAARLSYRTWAEEIGVNYTTLYEAMATGEASPRVEEMIAEWLHKNGRRFPL